MENTTIKNAIKKLNEELKTAKTQKEKLDSYAGFVSCLEMWAK